MLRRAPALLAALALTLAELPAEAAQAAPPGAAPAPAAYDTVVLRDGTVLRGTILASIPGQSVEIAVAVGGTRKVAWSEVASIGWAGGPGIGEGATSPANGPVPQDMAEPTPGPSRPRIFIELTRPAELHLLEAGMAAVTMKMSRSAYFAGSRSVCRAPCGKVIDGSAGLPMYFGGERLMPSRAFYLKDLEGDYVARVRPGRVGMFSAGLGVTGLGYAGTLTGGLLVGITRGETRAIGGAVLGAGLALLVAGIVMIVQSRTRYTLQRRTGARVASERARGPRARARG